MKIYLVRHGETEANYEGRMQGKNDQYSLTERGVRDTKKLKEHFKDKPLDLCITSPLKRTWETAMILVGDRVYIEEDTRLIERDLGEFEGKKRTEYDHKKYWDFNLNTDEHGVEKVGDIILRCEDFLKDLKENHQDQNILIVSHGAVIRALHHLLVGTNFQKEKDLTKLKIDTSFFREYHVK